MPTPDGFGYPTVIDGLRTVKLNVNYLPNVKGDICGIPEKVAIDYVMSGLAEPIGWRIKGNGKGDKIVIVPDPEPKQKKAKSV